MYTNFNNYINMGNVKIYDTGILGWRGVTLVRIAEKILESNPKYILGISGSLMMAIRGLRSVRTAHSDLDIIVNNPPSNDGDDRIEKDFIMPEGFELQELPYESDDYPVLARYKCECDPYPIKVDILCGVKDSIDDANFNWPVGSLEKAIEWKERFILGELDSDESKLKQFIDIVDLANHNPDNSWIQEQVTNVINAFYYNKRNQ